MSPSELGSGLGLTGFGFALGTGKEKKADPQVSFEKEFFFYYYFVEKIKHQVSPTVETLEDFFVHVSDKQYLHKVPIMFSFKKTLPTPPPPPKSCKSDKTNVNKSQFLVHWGCNSATPLQQLRSVFCTCFANTDKHTTQSQGPCTASQVKTK